MLWFGDWDDPDTLKLGEHPVIAVAEGSHALYPTSGVYRVSFLQENIYLGHHCCNVHTRREWVEGDAILITRRAHLFTNNPGICAIDLANGVLV